MGSRRHEVQRRTRRPCSPLTLRALPRGRAPFVSALDQNLPESRVGMPTSDSCRARQYICSISGRWSCGALGAGVRMPTPEEYAHRLTAVQRALCHLRRRQRSHLVFLPPAGTSPARPKRRGEERCTSGDDRVPGHRSITCAAARSAARRSQGAHRCRPASRDSRRNPPP